MVSKIEKNGVVSFTLSYLVPHRSWQFAASLVFSDLNFNFNCYHYSGDLKSGQSGFQMVNIVRFFNGPDFEWFI